LSRDYASEKQGLAIAVGYVRGGGYAIDGVPLISKKKEPDCAGDDLFLTLYRGIVAFFKARHGDGIALDQISTVLMQYKLDPARGKMEA
jgi:hypothetical protein